MRTLALERLNAFKEQVAELLSGAHKLPRIEVPARCGAQPAVAAHHLAHATQVLPDETLMELLKCTNNVQARAQAAATAATTTTTA